MAIRKICPECGQQYGTRPAVSRKDRKTEICPDCGNPQDGHWEFLVLMMRYQHMRAEESLAKKYQTRYLISTQIPVHKILKKQRTLKT